MSAVVFVLMSCMCVASCKLVTYKYSGTKLAIDTS